MSQKSLLAFAIALILASSGCLGFGDDELEQQENDDNEKQEPVGETNMTSLEKRIEHLESTIAEYELPKVYFLDLSENDYSWASYMTSFPDYEFYKSDDGYLSCYYSERYDIAIKSCNLNALYYDVDGMIEAYSWDGSEAEIEYTGMCQENTDPLICLIGTGGTGWIAQDVCTLTSVNQILTLTVYDNDGNSASASYDLDYDSACTVEEPDNTCASDSDCPPGTICQGGVCMEDISECEDGEEMIENGTMHTCVDGQWGAGEPVPDGTVCDDGNPDTENDAYYNGVCVGTPVNHPPEIASIYFDPYQVTNETETVCLIYEISDPDDDQLSIFVIWLINNEPIDELEPDQCFGLAGYTIEVGDHLAVDVTVHDNEYTVTETWFTEIEEEPE